MSGYEDERKTHSKSPLNEISRDMKLLNFTRPLTAVKAEPEMGQRKPLNRISGNKNKKPMKEKFSALAMKLKPNKIFIDKERLYTENMELKLKNNELSESLIKYKSKIIQLERENQKKPESPIAENTLHSNYLVRLLKQNIKELRAEVQSKENEILKHKKNARSSKLAELEVEVKAYIEECSRLRHIIQEAAAKNDFREDKSDGQISDLLRIIEENKAEIQRLKEKLRIGFQKQKNDKSPKFLEKRQKNTKEIEALKKELSDADSKYKQQLEALQSELSTERARCANTNFKLQEANSLIEVLYKDLRHIRQRRSLNVIPPKFFIALAEASRVSNKSVLDFLTTFDQGSGDSISTSQLLYNVKVFDQSLTNCDLESILPYIKAGSPAEVSISKTMNYFNTFEFTLNLHKDSDKVVKELMKHLVLRMQLHRIPRQDLMGTLISVPPNAKTIHSQEIILLFTNNPFDFNRKEAATMSEYLFAGQKSMKYTEFVDRLYDCIENWEVFTPKDEEGFDSYLLNIISVSGDILHQKCVDTDKEHNGIITFSEFKACLKACNAVLPERVEAYLIVLFYSHNMQLSSVPYEQFFQAYTVTDEVKVEDERADIPQKYLEEIAKSLIESGKSVRDAFKCDLNGNVVAEEFIEAIKDLRINEIPKDELWLLLEALQTDPEERVVCIKIEDLEEIFQDYGVNVDPETGSEIEIESLAGINEGHVQKVSMLEPQLVDDFS